MPISDADQELMDLQRSVSSNGVTAGMPMGDAAANPEAARTWEMRRMAQREAYGQYVAAGPIYIGNCLAFGPGQQVPLEHVIKYNLVEQELVNQVATPEMARFGKVYEDEGEFLAANPHVARQVKSRTLVGELTPAALDPRGGAAAIDDARQAAKSGKGKAKADDTASPDEAHEADVAKALDTATADGDDKPASKPTARRSASEKGGS